MSANPTPPVSVQSRPFQASPAQRRTPMADEDPQQPDTGAGSQPGLLPGLQGAETSALQLRIKNSICKSVQSKVEDILQDVEKFSDIEKLYLYLKLPTGPSSSAEKSDQSALSSSRTQQMHAFGWIRDYLEEYPETSLPKQEVYDEYKSFCDNLNYHPLSAADFGKMMKNVFPNMKARRLGMRGKSKYCYSGLRKRPFVHMPSLPTLDLHKSADGLQCDALESPCHVSGIKEEVRFAACDLVCEWAQKVLKRQFDAVEDLARFLIDSHYISNKSLAALTLMTGAAAAEVKPQQTVSAFAPTAEAQPFQPQGKMFSSPSVDAKQQLQRKIQRKQQEQKMLSPVLGEEQTKRMLDSVTCGSPSPPSPQPTIGIVVAAVPSPITVQKSGQLMSLSPVAAVESKVLPINFQMVSQPVQVVKQSPKPAQNNLTSPAGERPVRQRYAQILPKPSATSGIAMRSPSTMIITNSPIKTVMTTCQVSPVSLVKMTAISLAPTSGETTSLTNTMLRPVSAGVASAAAADAGSNQNARSASAVAVLSPITGADTQSMDVEMEVEAIHMNSQMQNPSSQALTQDGAANRAGGPVQRAASVPIPHSKGFLGLEETSANSSSGNSSSVVKSSSNTANKAGSLLLTSSDLNTSTLSLANTSRLLSCREAAQAEDGFLSTKSFRKRSGLTSDLSPVKRVFMPQQSAEGAGYVQGQGSSGRPESAPASRELERKMSSVFSSQVHVQSSSSLFNSVAKTQTSMQRKNTPSVMETGDTLMQEQRGHAVGNMHGIPANPGYQNHAGVTSNSAYQCSSAANSLQFVNQAAPNQLLMQEHMDYFSFDDDVTQDSIVEELVQMEEQMKLKRLQGLGSCGPLQGQAILTPNSVTSANQSMSGFYQAPCSLIHTSTPTSEVMGGAQALTGDSPCSLIASTTPVDSALGSSRHTPIGTPHSNCSSTIPPSPVECRNPFAFTPINSSMTCFHDSSPVSSSPVKPMQRPTATHPDKARLDWMNSSYSSSSGSSNKSNDGMGILTGYRGLTDEPFQKPHAFAVPHVRHHDGHCGRLTPISPVQQQVASMSRQEGFAVPAPLDNKTTCTTFRCRSVSPAVHQRNLSTLPNVPRSVVSPFNSPVTPEVLNIFANSEANLMVSSLAQRSRSVPLNVMMQTEVQQCSSISSILLSKLEGDHDDALRGLGVHGVPSTYTARMNLTQMLESNSSRSCGDDSLSLMASESSGSSQQPGYLIENTVGEQMSLSAGNNQTQPASAEQQQAQSAMLALSSQHQHLDFRNTQQHHLLTGPLMEQVSELTAGGADFPCEIRMTSELSGSINDLNSLDTNLLFDPSQQQSRFHSAASEELNDQLFQQISDTPHSGGLDWLESKDHPTVGLMG
ncbi:DNA-binding protein RFX7 isoform X2 [Xiphophorus couchianus]|uniref:DNA-binding protein RFX7 isoform X2 n=1 Tax=Xiphophorus couchianus TaxID=32473 RepID=UPI0010171F62|nr:DNA-binding protein RFX7 isoform X2 [Xiphophorus couchianus]